MSSQLRSSGIETAASSDAPARELDVYIPFTSLAETETCIRHAERLCAGLNAAIRLVRVLQVPYPLDLDRPCIGIETAAAQMQTLDSNLPVTSGVWLARDWKTGFKAAVPQTALIVMSCPHRKIFKTREEKVARQLMRDGYNVSLVVRRKTPNA